MKSTIFIPECQNLTEPSEGMNEARLFQHRFRYLLLMLVTLLGLLVGGIVGSFKFCVTQVTHQSNVTYGLNWTFNISGEDMVHIFTAVNNGIYFISGTLQTDETAEKCQDVIRLVWRSTESDEQGKKEKEMTSKIISFSKEKKMTSKNMTKHVAKIVLENVRLNEKSTVHLKLNCKYTQIKAEFTVLYIPEHE
ncbi:hypothetical protein Baya_15060 [Bagarius yarrelli]|uniref:Uncharacterized protein n=1 Tax=Bagarius yarrelli TaxID=175774 RepID=A0A556VAJ1_BAGYA|nr:hypothetical protein Baya_15060 [Bagarius yarrelli]